MPTEAIIERTAQAVWARGPLDAPSFETLEDAYRQKLLGHARAALAAALPTPEEHQRGIEAAVNRLREKYGIYAGAALQEAIAAYLSAVGLAP